MSKASNKKCRLVATSNNCGKAEENTPKWNVEKTVVVCDEKKKNVEVCLFKGDCAKIQYDIDVKQGKKEEICFTWHVKVENKSSKDTCGLKIGVKAHIIDDKGNKKCVGTFCGFEGVKPVIEAHCSHVYILYGTFSVNCDFKKKIFLNTDDLIHDDRNTAEALCNTICVEENHDKESCVIVKDNLLEFEEKIHKPKTIELCALYCMNDNIQNNEEICNVVKLEECCKCKNDKDSCDCKRHSCVSKASVKFEEAKLRLKCDFDCIPNKESWCLCQASDACEDVIEYRVAAKKVSEKKSKLSICCKVELDCCPNYKKEFSFVVRECDKDSVRKSILAEETFKLGKGDKHKTININHIELSRRCTHLLFTISAAKATVNVATGEVEEDECEDRIVWCDEKKKCNKFDKEANVEIRDELKLPKGGRYEIKDLGTFSDEHDLNKWLCGSPITICDDKEFCWTLKFTNCTEIVRNTAKLCAKGEKHSTITSSTAEDEIKSKHQRKHDDGHENGDSDHENDNDRHDDRGDDHDEKHGRHFVKPDRKNQNHNKKHHDDHSDQDDNSGDWSDDKNKKHRKRNDQDDKNKKRKKHSKHEDCSDSDKEDSEDSDKDDCKKKHHKNNDCGKNNCKDDVCGKNNCKDDVCGKNNCKDDVCDRCGRKHDKRDDCRKNKHDDDDCDSCERKHDKPNNHDDCKRKRHKDDDCDSCDRCDRKHDNHDDCCKNRHDDCIRPEDVILPGSGNDSPISFPSDVTLPADDCFYDLHRKKRDGKKHIGSGTSILAAMDFMTY